ncbi:MAG: MFS transporter, partial [Nitrososphaerota archaeon]|nr:MFS transporter [Nitrososphaerota archaeon]
MRDRDVQASKTEAFRGWTVLVSSFCMVLTFGIIYSYSDFFVPLEGEFGWSHALDSSIPAVALVVFSIGCVLSGYLNSRVSSRRMCYVGSIILGGGTILSSQVHNFAELMITFGVLSALGISFVVNVGTALAVKWFARRRGLAVGIAASGSGVGTLAVPPLTKFVVNFDWRVAFIVLGGSFLFLLLFASYFAQGPEDRNEKPYGWAEMSDQEILWRLLEPGR